MYLSGKKCDIQDGIKEATVGNRVIPIRYPKGGRSRNAEARSATKKQQLLYFDFAAGFAFFVTVSISFVDPTPNVKTR